MKTGYIQNPNHNDNFVIVESANEHHYNDYLADVRRWYATAKELGFPLNHVRGMWLSKNKDFGNYNIAISRSLHDAVESEQNPSHKSKNPVKYWILDERGKVHLTVTKGTRAAAEKIAGDLTRKTGKKYTVLGYGVENPTLTTDELKERLIESFDKVKPLRLAKLDTLQDAIGHRTVSVIPYKGFHLEVRLASKYNDDNWYRYVYLPEVKKAYYF